MSSKEDTLTLKEIIITECLMFLILVMYRIHRYDEEGWKHFKSFRLNVRSNYSKNEDLDAE